jgi:hypothetical protein
MREVQQSSKECASSPELYRILATSISIFDSAITLLGEPSACGVSLPSPAQVACMRYILHCLGIGEDVPEHLT